MSVHINFIKRKSLRERVWKTLNVVVGITTILNVSMAGALISPRAASAATLNVGVNLDQFANGKLSPPSDPEWQNGNLNSNNSHYVEGETVPFRLSVTGLSAGSHTIHLNYDYTSGGVFSYDYLANWNRTENPGLCTGLSGFTATCATTPALAAIPIDPDSAGFQPAGQNVKVYGATSASLALPYVLSGPTSGNSTKDIVLTFSVANDGDQVLVAWGGHLASSIDHGTGLGAASISGAPFHMRTQQLDNSGNKNQDRSIQPGSVLLGSITVTKVVDAGSATPSDWSFTISPDPAGTGPLSPAAGQSTVVFPNLPIGTYTVTESSVPGYHQVSSNCNNLTIAGTSLSTLNQSCVFHNAIDASTLTVIKHVVNDDGGTAAAADFTMTINGVTATGGNSFAGSETGVAKTVTTGAYSVTESGPAGYAASYSADCSGTINPGDNKTCTITNNDQAASLTVIKHVINDNGGTKTADDFTMEVTGSNVSDASFPGDEQGVTVSLNAGAYSVDETGNGGYAKTLSADCSGTIALGQHKTCTVTNNDIQPKLTVTKVVINDNGGTKVVGDFPLFVNQTPVTSGTQNGFNAGAYTVSETNQAGYTATISGDCAADGAITLNAGDVKSCTITNNDQAASLTVIKHVINDNGGTKVANQFTLNVTGSNVAPASFSGNENGTGVSLDAGAYAVSETPVAGYTTSYSADCSGSLNPGQHKTCTVTNDDQAARLLVIKHVVNDNGGTKTAGDFTMNVSGTNVSDPSFPGDELGTTVTLNAGQYSVDEGAHVGYDKSLSADCAGTIANGETKTCTVTNDDQLASLTVVKHVINNNGGQATADDFTMNVSGTNVSDASFPGDEQGTTVTLNAGAYAVDEDLFAGYGKTLGANCAGTIANGEQKTCVVTNDDIAPTITLIKSVMNDNGGTAGPNDFGLSIGATPVTSGQTLPVNANTAYALNELGLSGYAFSSLTGTGCPTQLAGTVYLQPGENVTCTITNDDIQPKLTVTKVVNNDNGGTKVIGDFPLYVDQTMVTSGVQNGFNAKTYFVSEIGDPGYTATISGDCDANGNVTLNIGDEKSCTITNDDIQPKLTITKVVNNDNGGTKVVSDFPLFVNQTPVTSGVQNGFNAGAYVVSETSLPGYLGTISGDCDANGAITLGAGDVKSCTITNDDQPASLTVIKHVIDDFGGGAVAGDFLMHVAGNNPSPSSFPGDENGTAVTINQGGYLVTEDTVPGYTPAYSADCSGSIAVGEQKTCIVSNTAQAPHLIVVKHVITDDGGTAVASEFQMNVTGTNVSDPSFPGDEQGTTVTLNQGAYSVDEASHAGYTKTLGPDCSGTIALGQTKTCVITNDDIAPTITLIKNVVNNNGGNAQPNDFGLSIGGTPVLSGQTLPVMANTNYALNELGADGYTFVSLTGPGCPSNLGDTVSLQEDEDITCTITNDDIAPTITLIKNVVNNNGGNAQPNDFGLSIGATAVNSGQTLPVNANTNYALNEVGLSGYAFVSLTGPGCPQNLGGLVNLDEGENLTCTITNDDVAPTVTLTKAVTNNNGGTAGPNDFGISVGGSSVLSGSTTPVNANTPIAINETGHPGYAFVSITGDAKCPSVLGGTVTLNEGEHVACTITNDDIQPKLTVTKVVINDDGGKKVVGDFPLYVDQTLVTSGNQNGFNADSYLVSEIGINGYAAAITGDCDTNGNVTLDIGDVKSCTITNDDIAPTVTLTKHVTPAESADPNDFGLTIGGNGVLSGVTTPVVANQDIALNEQGRYGFQFVSLTGDSGCPTQLGGTVNLLPGENISCTITNLKNEFGVDIEKSSQEVVEAGAQLTYTLTWAVTGNTTIHDVTITDPIGTNANMSFASATCGTTTGTCVMSDVGGVRQWALGDRQPGDSGTVTVTVNVATPLTNGTQLSNTGTVCGFGELDGDFEGDPAMTEKCDDDTVTTRVHSAPTITIVKSGPATVGAGQDIAYTLTWSIGGNAPATNTVITDAIPANTSFVSSTCGTTSGTCVMSALAGTVSWNLGTRNPGENGTVTMTVKAASPIPNGTIVTNNACIDTTENELVCDDTTTTVQSAPSLSIVKSNDIVGFTNPGKQVIYTVTVTNSAAATDTAHVVVLTDVLPAGFTYTVGGGTTKDFALGEIVPGASVVTTYAVTISATQAAGIYTNTASAQGTNTTKVSATSNVDVRVPSVLGITAEPMLVLAKTVNPTTSNLGKVVTYTVTISNPGDADLTNVTLTDELPAGLTFVDTGKATKTWSIGTLKANHQRVINYQVRIGDTVKAGTYTNIATVTSNELDPQTAQAPLVIKVPQVQGLATTGVSARDYFVFVFGLGLMSLGLYWLGRLRRQLNGQLSV